MSMNEQLAAEYGTGLSDEERTKQANAELFMKLASENNIDLSSLSDEQITQLYNDTFVKAAEDNGEEKKDEKKDEGNGGGKPMPPFMKKDDDKEKEAAAHIASQQEWASDRAKADFLGRQMAHAFADESVKIAAAKTAKVPETPAATKEAAAAAPEGKSEGVKEASAQAPGAEAFEELAQEHAVKVAEAAGGIDLEEVKAKVAAVATLGLAPDGEKSKVASAQGLNLETAKHIRALEYLEAAGYPVTWNEQ